MSTTNPPVPGVVPTLISTNCKEHIQWIKTVFEAEQYEFYTSEDNLRVLHCVLGINDGYLYISDAMEEFSKMSAESLAEEPAGFMLSLELEHAEEAWQRATCNGGTVTMEWGVKECGNLYGSFKDPFGFVWGVMKETPTGKPGVVPYIIRDGDCEKHIQWIEAALGGVVKDKRVKDGKIEFCSLEVNGGPMYASDGHPIMKQLSNGNNRFICHMTLSDPYPLWEQLLKNGATSMVDLDKQFWGGTYGAAKDPMGFEWSLSNKTADEDKSSSVGVTPYILSSNCDQHIEWVQKVFGGEVKDIFRTTKEKRIMHCRILFNGGHLFLCDRKLCALEEKNQVPQEANSEAINLHVVLPDPDAIWKKALGNDAKPIVDLKQQFWGGYFGCFRDPFGVRWAIMKSHGQQ